MTYSPSALMGLPIIDYDTEGNTWGEIINNYLTARVEQGIHGIATVGITGSDVTLNDTNYVGTEAHKKLLVFTGIQTASVNVIVPSKQRVYMVRNACTGGAFTITMKTSTQTGGVSLAQSEVALVYCTGTTVELFFKSSTFQSSNAALSNILAQPPTDNGVMVGNGAQWATESGDTLRASLGVPPLTRRIETLEPILGASDLSGDVTISLNDSGVTAQTNVIFPIISVNLKGQVTALSGFKSKAASFAGADAAITNALQIGSVVRTGVGRYTINFTTPYFTTADSYTVSLGVEATQASTVAHIVQGTQLIDSIRVEVQNSTNGNYVDPARLHVFCIGS